MGATAAPSVDDYISGQPEPVHAILQKVRSTIRRALPEAEETISYKIPTYRLHGTYVIYFAAWKHHYSLYPVTESIVAGLETDLAGYELAKGTIRFPFSEPVPTRLIARLARLLAGSAKARAARQRQRAKAHK